MAAYFDVRFLDTPDLATKLTTQLNDPDVQKQVAEEAAKGFESVQSLTKAFGDVTTLLRLVDRKKLVGRNGEKIRQFSPAWSEYHNRFKTLHSTCEKFATDSVGTIRLFREHVLQSFVGARTLEEQERAVDHFIKILDRDQKESQRREATDIQIEFAELASDVEAFHRLFTTTMDDVGMALDQSIKIISEDIQALQRKLETYSKSAKALGRAVDTNKAASKTMRFAIGCSAFFHSAGSLTPGALLSSTAKAAGKETATKYNEDIKGINQSIKEKEDKLKEMIVEKTMFDRFRPSIDQATQGIQTVSEKLVILTQIFKLVQNDCADVEKHLKWLRQNSQGGATDQPLMDARLALACYERLETILDAFSTGSKP